MPPVSQCIVNFLSGQRKDHPGKDLLDRYQEHGIDMETQVNVAAGNGEPVAGKRATWTNGCDEWWNLRVPKCAMDEPSFNDYNLTWPLEEHADGIGSTGWNWRKRVSLWVGFDFDALVGHAQGVGISDQDLLEVRRKASELPYVETRKSTGGKGLHLYVHLDAIPTANHTEHAALARCILGMMSTETGYDFARQIDCCGSVMWFWHRKMTMENDGLALIKASTKVIGVDDLPANWKDHVEVVSRKRTKVRVNGIDNHDIWDDLTDPNPRIQLDATHKATIDELARSGYSTVWIPDYHLCQTHTGALKALMEDAQISGELGLRGVFDTTSQGSDRATPNAFMFPLLNGAWKVYRFGQGVSEHSTWEQDGEGWTTCYFNQATVMRPRGKLISCRDLATAKYDLDYIIDRTLVANQPAIIGGPKKALKTSIAVDAALSLATGTPMLGHLTAKKRRTLLLSGESGMPVLQETALRIAASKNVDLESVETLWWSDWLPRFDHPPSMEELRQMIRDSGCEVLFIDPVYLCMGGKDAANLMEMGSILRNVSELCTEQGVTPILLHHARKNTGNGVMELHDLTYAGFGEFARQWWLIGRRKSYEPGTGFHQLWLSIGGSAGHSAKLALDIRESVYPDRIWDVSVSSPGRNRHETVITPLRDEILKVLQQFPDGETPSEVLRLVGARSGSRDPREALDSLIVDGSVVTCQIKKSNNHTYDAVRLVR